MLAKNRAEKNSHNVMP